MECTHGRGSGGFLLIARRNNSLSKKGSTAVLGSLLLVSVAISVAFAAYGAWLVVPFAGLEMVALIAAFAYIQRHAGDYESIAIEGDRVLVERWETGRPSRYELNRHWAQVVMHPAGLAGHGVLALRSHGKEIEFGRHLTEDQRQAAARALKQHLTSRDAAVEP